jgi:hypothetical protein
MTIRQRDPCGRSPTERSSEGTRCVGRPQGGLKQQHVTAQKEKEKARLKHQEEAKKIVVTSHFTLLTLVKITIGDKDVQLGEGSVNGTRVMVTWRALTTTTKGSYISYAG